MGYNPWGHKGSNTTEGLILSIYASVFYPPGVSSTSPCAAPLTPPPRPTSPKVVRLNETPPDSAKWQNFAKGQNHSNL